MYAAFHNLTKRKQLDNLFRNHILGAYDTDVDIRKTVNRLDENSINIDHQAS